MNDKFGFTFSRLFGLSSLRSSATSSAFDRSTAAHETQHAPIDLSSRSSRSPDRASQSTVAAASIDLPDSAGDHSVSIECEPKYRKAQYHRKKKHLLASLTHAKSIDNQADEDESSISNHCRYLNDKENVVRPLPTRKLCFKCDSESCLNRKRLFHHQPSAALISEYQKRLQKGKQWRSESDLWVEIQKFACFDTSIGFPIQSTENASLSNSYSIESNLNQNQNHNRCSMRNANPPKSNIDWPLNSIKINEPIVVHRSRTHEHYSSSNVIIDYSLKMHRWRINSNRSGRYGDNVERDAEDEDDDDRVNANEKEEDEEEDTESKDSADSDESRENRPIRIDRMRLPRSTVILNSNDRSALDLRSSFAERSYLSYPDTVAGVMPPFLRHPNHSSHAHVHLHHYHPTSHYSHLHHHFDAPSYASQHGIANAHAHSIPSHPAMHSTPGHSSARSRNLSRFGDLRPFEEDDDDDDTAHDSCADYSSSSSALASPSLPSFGLLSPPANESTDNDLCLFSIRSNPLSSSAANNNAPALYASTRSLSSGCTLASLLSSHESLVTHHHLQPPPHNHYRSAGQNHSQRPTNLLSERIHPPTFGSIVPLVARDNSNSDLPPNGCLVDRRRVSRPLTGRHVRSGTGASPTTLALLRQVLLERRRQRDSVNSTLSPIDDKKNRKKRR